jgi:hypothetical protein
MQIKELKEGIAAFYDESSGLWENVWGEHMHHGRCGALFSSCMLSLMHQLHPAAYTVRQAVVLLL